MYTTYGVHNDADPALCQHPGCLYPRGDKEPSDSEYPVYWTSRWTMYRVFNGYDTSPPPYLAPPPGLRDREDYQASSGITYYDSTWKGASGEGAMEEHYEGYCLPIFPFSNKYSCSFISLGDVAFFVTYDDRPNWMPKVCLFSPRNHPPGARLRQTSAVCEKRLRRASAERSRPTGSGCPPPWRRHASRPQSGSHGEGRHFLRLRLRLGLHAGPHRQAGFALPASAILLLFRRAEDPGYAGPRRPDGEPELSRLRHGQARPGANVESGRRARSGHLAPLSPLRSSARGLCGRSRDAGGLGGAFVSADMGNSRRNSMTRPCCPVASDDVGEFPAGGVGRARQRNARRIAVECGSGRIEARGGEFEVARGVDRRSPEVSTAIGRRRLRSPGAWGTRRPLHLVSSLRPGLATGRNVARMSARTRTESLRS